MELVRRSTQSWVAKRAPTRTDTIRDRSISPFGVHHEPDESAPTAIGRIAYEKLFGHPPSEKTKNALSWAVHIGYGLSAGALFAAVRPQARLRDGALYSTALWLFGDELGTAVLGLADNPMTFPPIRHAASLAQHLGYGLVLATATRAIVGGPSAHACSCGCS